MAEPCYRYCPLCAAPLIERIVGTLSRPVCPACGFVLYLGPKVVTVVVIEHEGRLLLGRRDIEPGRGKWSFCSGYVDRGERPEDAAVREVKEETNIDVELTGMLGLYSLQGDPHLLVAYCARPRDGRLGNLAPQPGEVSELAFFRPDEVPALAFPLDQQILRDWLAAGGYPQTSGPS
jgi:8-oxo-dGTP diphosphatase